MSKTMSPILRGTLTLLLLVTYLVTATGSLVHELAHVDLRSSTSNAGAAIDHGHPGVEESGGASCFFCINGPTQLLLATSLLLLIHPSMQRRVAAPSVSVTIRRLFPFLPARAPPVLR